MDLATGHVEIMAENGRTPSISCPYVAWAESQDEPSTQIEGANKGVIVVLNLQTGDRRKLKGPDTPKRHAIYKDSIVWITAKGNEVILTDIEETFRKTIALATGDEFFEDPSLSDRLITWRINAKPQVWDRAQNRLVTLENDRVYTCFVTLNRLVWLSPIPGGDENAPGAFENRTINILDTTQLPK